MNTSRKAALSLMCALTLAGNAPGILAQTASQDKSQQPERTYTYERQIITHGGPGQEMPLPPDILIGAPGPQLGFSYLATEMSFDSKIVTGAPFSADAVTESVQVLGDGNRIVRSSTTSLYRDSDGRTRREQSLSAIGPLAASANQKQQMIFINDPVAGTNYILDPTARTYRKMDIMVHRSTLERAPGNDGKPEGESGNAVFMARTNENARPAALNLQANTLKRVQPGYPAVAKAAGASGPVQVRVTIGTDGHVVGAEAVSGHPLLRDAAVDAARQWEFKPTEVSGATVKAQGVLTFNFTLQDSSGEPATQKLSIAQGGVAIAQALPKAVTESLGEQVFDGIKAQGTRSVTTIPAGQIGNEKALEIVFEKWYSPELQTVILTKQSDPRFGETTFRLVNIVRKEPAKSLFEIPSDYSAASMPTERTFNWKVERPNQQ